MPQIVTDVTFAEAVLASKIPVVVDFWDDWCPPCRAIAPVLAELAEEFRGRLVIAKINSGENPIATRTYRILSLPTLLFFRDGQVTASMIGARPKSVLRENFGAHLSIAV